MSENIIVYSILFIIFYYAIFKEREELWCTRFSIKRQCIDENSVYLKDTKYIVGDNKKQIIKKIISILSYHEKAGVWRRALIISGICILMVIIVNKLKKEVNVYYYTNLLCSFFTVIYFYHNYINYHHFRNLKNNGIELLSKL